MARRERPSACNDRMEREKAIGTGSKSLFFLLLYRIQTILFLH